ncbi:MAG: hypothetical protein U0835_23770, partial [Isosphaeraceae bacterium]
MARYCVRVLFGSDPVDFDPQSLDPGTPMLDPGMANYRTLVRWAGEDLVAEPVMAPDGKGVAFHLTRGGLRRLELEAFPVTNDELDGVFAGAVAQMDGALRGAKWNNDGERALLNRLLANWEFLQTPEGREARLAHWFKFEERPGAWSPLFCWGYAVRPELGMLPVHLCENSSCASLFVHRGAATGARLRCPHCKGKAVPPVAAAGGSGRASRAVAGPLGRSALAAGVGLGLLALALLWWNRGKKDDSTAKDPIAQDRSNNLIALAPSGATPPAAAKPSDAGSDPASAPIQTPAQTETETPAQSRPPSSAPADSGGGAGNGAAAALPSGASSEPGSTPARSGESTPGEASDVPSTEAASASGDRPSQNGDPGRPTAAGGDASNANSTSKSTDSNASEGGGESDRAARSSESGSSSESRSGSDRENSSTSDRHDSQARRSGQSRQGENRSAGSDTAQEGSDQNSSAQARRDSSRSTRKDSSSSDVNVKNSSTRRDSGASSSRAGGSRSAGASSGTSGGSSGASRSEQTFSSRDRRKDQSEHESDSSHDSRSGASASSGASPGSTGSSRVPGRRTVEPRVSIGEVHRPEADGTLPVRFKVAGDVPAGSVRCELLDGSAGPGSTPKPVAAVPLPEKGW